MFLNYLEFHWTATYSLHLQFCWGPLSFIIAYCIATQHPARHPLQLIVSLGQIYGDILYYGTSLFDISYCRPEKYYFWFYYVFFNFIWVVVPFCEYISFLYGMTWGRCWYSIDYMRQSFVEIVRAFRKIGEQSFVPTKKSWLRLIPSVEFNVDPIRRCWWRWRQDLLQLYHRTS